MKALNDFAKLLQWPTVFLVLTLALDDKWHAVFVTLALVYRNDLSAVLRRRRLYLRMPGFRCRLDDVNSSPREAARNPPV